MQRRYRRPKPKVDPIKHFKTNERILAPEVFLIDEKGTQVGPTKTVDALESAQELELDLVEVGPKAKPPVAKLMDYGQYKYETEKKVRKAKAHQKTTELKAIRLSFRIKGKDLETKQKQAQKFLDDGNKVKVDIILKGRERAHKPLAIENMNTFVKNLGDDIKVLQPVAVQGGQISTTVTKS